jgi:DNA-binding CsgD family transcriptional regulator
MESDNKRKILLAYAESFPINDLPGFTNVMSIDSKYIRVSDNALPLIGYKTHYQLFETDYYAMPCKASENAKTLEKEDQLALSQEIKIISYHHFHDDWKVFLGHKKPILHHSEVIGTLANFMDITNHHIIDISRFLLGKDNKVTQKQFSYILQSEEGVFGLTKKEQECLFYVMRGFSYAEISKILHIALTTIQTHIEHIKQKWGVETKSQLIEKGIQLSFLNFIPKSLFK